MVVAMETVLHEPKAMEEPAVMTRGVYFWVTFLTAPKDSVFIYENTGRLCDLIHLLPWY